MKQTANTQKIYEFIKQCDRKEHAQEERDRSNKLYYSLESDNAYVEKHSVNLYGSPQRELVRKEARQILYSALNRR